MSDEHPLKLDGCNVVIVEGNEIKASERQPLKQFSGIVVTLSGMLI
jgi:hypothetical protein